MNIKTWRQNKKGKIIENWLHLFQIQFFNSENFHNFRTYYLIHLYIYILYIYIYIYTLKHKRMDLLNHKKRNKK